MKQIPNDWKWMVGNTYYKLGKFGWLYYWGAANLEWYKSSESPQDIKIAHEAERAHEKYSAAAKKHNDKKKAIIRVGQEFGFLTVIKIDPKDNWTVRCECDCGTVGQFNRAALLAGRTVSCGCQTNSEMTRRMNKRYGNAP